MDYYYSLIQGRVLPRDSAEEVVFRVERQDGPAAPELLALLRRRVMEGAVDVTLCYCSVYEECWMASLQDVIRRSRGAEGGVEERSAERCESAPRSGI